MLIREQKAAADALGVSPRWLREWEKEPGFPKRADRQYDIEAIEDWRESEGRKGSEQNDQARKLKLATAAQRLRFEKVRADAAERAEEVAKGNILPRDELETAGSEIVSLARDRFMGLGKEICKSLPRSLHRKVLPEIEKIVTRILNELANGFARLEAGQDD